ncbi:MAG TPA: efflux RND transporter periplasmic adaptor subunit [Opitutaceae bacterium]|nr:efflux RND transporter periplasmic adaptor subunit [Opitutaceae bacterium]
MTAALSPGNAPAVAATAKPRRKSKLKWWVMGGTVLVAALIVLAVIKKRSANVGTPVTTEKAVTKTIVQTVTATGKVQPEVEVKITPEVYGEIVSLPYREGAVVKKGEVIVKIKPDFYQAQVDQQTAAVAAARSAAVNSLVQLEKADADLKKYQDLYDRKLVSDFDYVTYKTADDGARANRESALAQVDEAEGLLKQAKDSLSKTSIYAPMDGTVSSRSSEVGERVQSSSEFAGTEIMRVADLSKMEVRVKVNENDIVNVKVGDPVKISIDAYPDRKFNGTVREIAASADNNGATGSGASAQAAGTVSDEVTNFIVKIRVADKDVALRPGMSATADIETQTVKNVVAVPIQSVTVRAAGGMTAEELEQKKAKEVHERSGNDIDVAVDKVDAQRDRDKLLRVVFVRDGEKVKLQKVETGIADNTTIEVKSGLKSGDEVVSGTYAAISRLLKDGSKIRIEKPKPEAAETK